MAMTAVVAALSLIPSAQAATVVSACQLTDVTPMATDCKGFLSGNLISGNSADLAASADAVNALLGTTYTGATLPIVETLKNLSGSTIDFATTLAGPSVFAFHVGGANGNGGVGSQSTGFFLIDAGSGLDSITLNVGGLSNARLFTTSVPEPATWAMLLAGFGVLGYALRRKSTTLGARIRLG